jgi:hypothetical protein
LSDAAVDQQDVGENVSVVAQFAEAPGDNFADVGVIINAFDVANTEPSLTGLEWQPIDELH